MTPRRALRVWLAPVLAGVATVFIAPHAEATRACTDFVNKLPNVTAALCEGAGLQSSDARSVRGQTLYTRDIAPADARLRVLVIGAIHGDELSSASVALHWIRLAQDPLIQMPQPVHWRFIPALNPDGLLNRPPRRVNANGVDLNRNFPTPGWAEEAPVYWEKRTRKDPRRWPGHTPLSEPESRFLHQQMDQFQPQLVVSIHAPYGVLDFDGPHDPPLRLGRLRMDKLGVFPGSLGHYGGLHRGVPVVTIELEHALRMPPDAEVRAMWRDLRHWMNTRLLDGADAVAGVKPPGLRR